MVNPNQIAEVAAVIGEPARAAMLVVLMDARALTATELARVAGITPQTASSHLSRLVQAGLVAVEAQGRHRYHRLASADVARMLEGVMLIVSDRVETEQIKTRGRSLRTGPRDEAMRFARTCYDHIAGRLGVALSDALVARGMIEFGDEAGVVTDAGHAFFETIGISLGAVANGGRLSRPICGRCLDWSERRPHLGGRLGAALCTHCLDHGWVRRRNGSRALEITPKGQRSLRDVFDVRLDLVPSG